MQFGKYLLVLIAATWLTGSVQQGNQPIEHYGNHGEVYFRLEPMDAFGLGGLPGWVSIDRPGSGHSLFAYAPLEKMKEWMPGDNGFVVEYLQHPSTLIQPRMMEGVDLEDPGDWDYYPTYEAYLGLMEQFETEYPGLCEVFSIGQSAEGREIMMAVVTSGIRPAGEKPKVLYTSSIHGDETAGYVLFLRLIDHLLGNYGDDPAITDLVDNLEIWINPLANPDGTFAGGNSSVFGATRFNANGVDINRNFPDPEDGDHPDGNAWQPETLVFMDLAQQTPFVMSLNCHGGAEVFNYPWDTWPKLHADDNWWYFVGREWADTVHAHAPAGYFDDLDNGVTNGYQWYSISGGRQDFMNYFHHCREVTLEISNAKILPATQLADFWEYNHRSFLNYLRQARYGITGRVVDAGTGDPLKATLFIEDHDLDNSWVVSNDEGRFFRPTYAGTYDLTFFSPGYAMVTLEEFSLGNYEAAEILVELEYTGSGVNDRRWEEFFTLTGNPGTGPFILEYSGNDPLEVIVLVNDIAGQEIFGSRVLFGLEEESLRIHLEQSGLYLLSVHSGRGVATFKLIRK